MRRTQRAVSGDLGRGTGCAVTAPASGRPDVYARRHRRADPTAVPSGHGDVVDRPGAVSRITTTEGPDRVPHVQQDDATRDARSSHSERRARTDVLFASSAGGHLAQLIQLRPWFERHSRLWITFELPDAVSLLDAERSVWAFHPTTRNIPNLLRNCVLAWRVVRRERPKVIVSSGAAIAVPFFWIGKLFGAKNVYLEVIDRIDSRTLTTRLCSPVTDLIVVQDDAQARLFPGSAVIGRLL